MKKILCLLVALMSTSIVRAESLRCKGKSKLLFPAEKVFITVGVVSEDVDAAKALEKNNQKMNQVNQAIKEVGLTSDEISTSRFEINPVYTPTPKNPPAGWHSELIGFRVNHKIYIATEKMDLASLIIDVSVSSGANTLDSISFGLKNTRDYELQALSDATVYALSKANTISEAAKIKLGSIIEITEETSGPYMGKCIQLSCTSEMGSTHIEACDIEISASVTVEFEIN